MSLDSIVGSEMSSVIFIRDYIQLVFEGMDRTQTLTAFSIPSVSIMGIDYQNYEQGYRDALCSLINSKVIAVETSQHIALIVHFGDTQKVKVSLKEADYEGPEAAMLEDGGNLTVW